MTHIESIFWTFAARSSCSFMVSELLISAGWCGVRQNHQPPCTDLQHDDFPRTHGNAVAQPHQR
eukprot:117572-Prymnesium_polylepis.1